MNAKSKFVRCLVLGILLVSCAAAKGKKKKEVKAQPGTVQENQNIDHENSEQPVIPDKVVPVGKNVKIHSVTFTPPKPKKFAPFDSGSYVDIRDEPGTLPKEADPNSDDEIKVIGTFLATNAANWPLRAEGNLSKDGKKGKKTKKGGHGKDGDFWAAKIGNSIVVVLTFDDGPHGGGLTNNITIKMMRELSHNSVQKNVKAMWNVQTHVPYRGGGSNGQKVIRAQAGGGHVVGIHTGSDDDHVKHTKRVVKKPYDVDGDNKPDGLNALESDMIRAKTHLKELTREVPKYVRPVGGGHNKAVRATYERQKLKMILWDIDSRDTAKGATANVVKKALKKGIEQAISQNEGEVVVLFHELKPVTRKNIVSFMKTMKDAAKKKDVVLTFAASKAEIEQTLDRM